MIGNLIKSVIFATLTDMFPVLFSIGKISVSTFGVFLSLGFILGIFLIWRLARAWDIDEEKILDLTLLTFIGGLVGARVYFVLTNLSFFIASPLKIILFTKNPGFSFWGGFLGGWLTLYFLTRRSKLDFLQLADIGIVGFFGGLIMANLGCLFGGCGAGILTHSFLGVSMIGLIGKRWPIQLLEALIYFLILINIWSSATHFHQRGRIISLCLIFIGVVELIFEPLRQIHSEGFIFSIVLIFLGLTYFYKVTKRNIILDIKNFSKFSLGLFTRSENRLLVVTELKKIWYNQKVIFSWRLRNIKKTLRRFNVRFYFKNNQQH